MIRAVFYRSPHNYDLDEASVEAAEFNDEPSMTIQSMAEDADLNVIMRRFNVTGKMPENPRLPSYGDFSEVVDYRSALHALMDAESAFMELPGPVRARFENDPQKYMEFVHDPANADEMVKLGFRVEPPKVEEPKPMKVEVVNPEVPKS